MAAATTKRMIESALEHLGSFRCPRAASLTAQCFDHIGTPWSIETGRNDRLSVSRLVVRFVEFWDIHEEDFARYFGRTWKAERPRFAKI